MLPKGSVSRIAKTLQIEEQTVRNYFGAKKYENGELVSVIITPGPGGGIVHLENTEILEAAKRLLSESTFDSIEFELNSGAAPLELVADILSDLSILYFKKGGSGLDFSPNGINIVKEEILV